MIKDIWKEALPKQLAVALSNTEAISDMQNLLRDLLTEKEIVEISARLEASRMLKNGKKYTEVIEVTKLSSRTVARISEWLKNGAGGYNKTIDNIESHHSHTLPVRD